MGGEAKSFWFRVVFFFDVLVFRLVTVVVTYRRCFTDSPHPCATKSQDHTGRQLLQLAVSGPSFLADRDF